MLWLRPRKVRPASRRRCDARRCRRHRSAQLGETLRELGAQEAELRRKRTPERLTAVEIEVAGLERENATSSRGYRGRRDRDADGRGGRRAAQVERLEQRREALGQVNPLAAEEHARESERLKDLVAQRQDLERSLVELEKLRDDLTNTVERMFERRTRRSRSTLRKWRRRCSQAARTTHPHGRRGAGHRDRAQPAGKRITRLSLLSGGEKALGAISFLFSLFLARPCPFYLLDEVEAALDDANIGRFIDLADVLRPRTVHRRHAPANHRGRRHPLRRLADGRRRRLPDRLQAAQPGTGRSSVGVTRSWAEPPRRGGAAGRAGGKRRGAAVLPAARVARRESAGAHAGAPLQSGRRRFVGARRGASPRADCGVPATVEIVQRLEEREPANEGEPLDGLESVIAELVSLEGDGQLAVSRPACCSSSASTARARRRRSACPHHLGEYDRSGCPGRRGHVSARRPRNSSKIWAQRAG